MTGAELVALKKLINISHDFYRLTLEFSLISVGWLYKFEYVPEVEITIQCIMINYVHFYGINLQLLTKLFLSLFQTSVPGYLINYD